MALYGVSIKAKEQQRSTNIESRGRDGAAPIRKGGGCPTSQRKRFPDVSAPGVKKPAPVVVGTIGLGCCGSSVGNRRVGWDRGGNNSSI